MPIDPPDGPKKVDRVDRVDATAPARPADGVDSVDPVAPAAPVGQADAVEAVQPVPTDALVVEVIEGVQAALATGQIASPDDAFEAVIDRLVEQRYPMLDEKQRLRFAGHLRSILPDDPVLGARLKALIGGR